MDEITQAHARLLKDTSIQFRFPNAAHVAPPPLVAPPGGSSLLHAGGGLFWAVVAAAALLLAVVAVQAVRGRGLPAAVGTAGAGDETAQPASVAFPASALADADALAGTGDYGAAVHALLLRGIGAIQERFPRAMLPAHTSRDIAALAALPPALREAFSGIAARTERAVFAGLPLGREDWEASRALYAGLLGAAASSSGWAAPS